MDSEYIQTNITITKGQRKKLQFKENSTGKSMAQLIRIAIDNEYPDPPPFEPTISPNLQHLPKPASVDIKEDIKTLSTGMTQAVFDRLFKKNDTSLD